MQQLHLTVTVSEVSRQVSFKLSNQTTHPQINDYSMNSKSKIDYNSYSKSKHNNIYYEIDYSFSGGHNLWWCIYWPYHPMTEPLNLFTH